MKYRPGELDQRITIQRETPASDGMGGVTLTLSDVATVAAKVIAMSGNEREDFDALQAEHKYRFVIRWRSDILKNDRIVWRGVEFNIRSIADFGPRTMYLEMDAERGVAQ